MKRTTYLSGRYEKKRSSIRVSDLYWYAGRTLAVVGFFVWASI